MYKALKAAALSGIGKFYRSRDHEASPFFKVLRHQFDEFESISAEVPGTVRILAARNPFLD
jgi:hypothetical protein